MIREYISWIGLFSSTKNGIEMLNNFKIYETLRSYVSPQGTYDHILILLLFCLDYGKASSEQGHSREYL